MFRRPIVASNSENVIVKHMYMTFTTHVEQRRVKFNIYQLRISLPTFHDTILILSLRGSAIFR